MVVKSKQVKLSLVNIGPENIDEHLIKCKSNRTRTRRHINTYVRLIKQGNFRDGGFIFADSKGNYHDAQHRLYALKITSHVAQFWVIQGLDAEDLSMMIDSGKKRSNAQRLGAMAVKRAGLINSAIEEILDVQTNWKKHAEMLMPDEILDFLNKNDILRVLAENWATSGVQDIKHRHLVALEFLFREIDKEKSVEFFNGIKHRHTLNEGDPLFAFFQMLQGEIVTTDQNPARVDRYIRNGLVIAWNAFLKGESLDHITPNENRITIEGTAAIESEPFADESNDGSGNVEDEFEVETD